MQMICRFYLPEEILNSVAVVELSAHTDIIPLVARFLVEEFSEFAWGSKKENHYKSLVNGSVNMQNVSTYHNSIIIYL